MGPRKKGDSSLILEKDAWLQTVEIVSQLSNI